MARWLLLTGFYLWLGFTAGYYFRKWLERSWLPRYQRTQQPSHAGPPHPPEGPGSPEP